MQIESDQALLFDKKFTHWGTLCLKKDDFDSSEDEGSELEDCPKEAGYEEFLYVINSVYFNFT